MSRYLLPLLLLGWTIQAEAFFCLSFSGNKVYWPKSFGYPGAYATPLHVLPLAEPPLMRKGRPLSATNNSSIDIPVGAEPEIIQGYRFRPLQKAPATRRID